METFSVEAYPYVWPFDGVVAPEQVALLVIDMQVDFCGEGGYVDAIGYDISLTRAAIEPIRRLLTLVRAVPGIRDAAVASALPLQGWGDGMPFRLASKPDQRVGSVIECRCRRGVIGFVIGHQPADGQAEGRDIRNRRRLRQAVIAGLGAAERHARNNNRDVATHVLVLKGAGTAGQGYHITREYLQPLRDAASG